MRAEDLVVFLEGQWDDGGFFDALRQGQFSESQGEAFGSDLRSIELSLSEVVPARLLSLTWFMPVFMLWQKERVAEVSGKGFQYDKFIDEATNVFIDVFGAP